MLSIVVFAEAASDAEIACGLADRIFEELGNLQRENLASHRSWLGYKPDTTFIEKKQITGLFNKLKTGHKRPRFLGYIGGKPKGSYTAFWRQAVELVVAMSKSQPISGVLIHCDVDAGFGQRKDIEQACSPNQHLLKFVLAIPDREMEVWLLNGFCPQNPAEKKRLAEWKRNLSFDPCKDAHRARDTSGDRNPKNILQALTDRDEDRKRSCWSETELSILRQRGETTGLTDFLKDVETIFLPLLSH